MITREHVMDGFSESKLRSVCSKLLAYFVNPEEWHQARCGMKVLKTSRARRVTEMLAGC